MDISIQKKNYKKQFFEVKTVKKTYQENEKWIFK